MHCKLEKNTSVHPSTTRHQVGSHTFV
jgi:hypothetical protein